MQKPDPSWFESEKNEAIEIVNKFCLTMQARGYEFIFVARHPFGVDLSAARGAPTTKLGFANAARLVAEAELLSGLAGQENAKK